MNIKETKWMKFLGGKNIIFSLIVLFLIGITFLLYAQLDFIFRPLFTIISTVITPVVISFILYYLLVPVVDYFEEKGVKRVFTIIGVYLIVIGLLTWLIIWLIPRLQQQFNELLDAIPTFINNLVNFARDTVENLGLSEQQTAAFNNSLQSFENIEGTIIDYLSRGFSGVGTFISGITNVFVILLMVPVILFFFLKDGTMFIEGFMHKMPPGRRKDVSSILKSIDSQVGSYIKGQIIVALVNGTLMFIGFTIIGLNYSGILAVAGGIMSFIPYLGPTLTFVPAAIIALSDSFWMVGKLVVVWGVIQFIEGNLVEPNVLGRRLNVHPVTIIFILLVMGELLGLVGMILGVPIYAILKVFFTYWFMKYQIRYNTYFGDEEGNYKVDTMSDVYDIEE